MFIDLMKRKSFLFVFILVIFLFFVFLRPKTKADLIYFYPQTCLGSFTNPEKAQGEREVDNPDLINEANSAVYYSGFKEIYCGNFQGPIKEGEIKKITLHFNWVLTKELREKPIIESTQSESFIEKILPSKTIEINIATSDVPIYNLNEINTGGSELYDNDINSSEVNETDTNELNKTNEEEIESATSSQIFRFIKFVFAQEETLSDISTNENIDESINESANESTNENTNTSINESTDQTFNDTNTSDFNSSSSVETTTETTETSTETSIETSTTITETSTEISTDLTPEIQENIIITPKNLFDIHYTLDGQNWNYLGSINENNWQGINFEIPVNDWLDISKIQIKINSYPDTDYYLYLESMWLEVEYVSGIKEIIPDDISTLDKSLALDRAFEYQKLVKIKGTSNNKILAILSKGEIWFFDLAKERQIKISEDIASDFDLGIKNNYAFWLSKDKTKIYYLNLSDLNLKEKSLETPDFSQRIYLNLSDLDFTVILEGNNFYFQVPQIGEVFSDENSIARDNFIKVFDLNKLLSSEELNNLGYYEESSE